LGWGGVQEEKMKLSGATVVVVVVVVVVTAFPLDPSPPLERMRDVW